MLSKKIRTQIDRGKDAPVLQSPLPPASQPTTTPRRTFGYIFLAERQQPNNHVTLASDTTNSNRRSGKMPHVIWALITEESSRRWRRMSKCTNCLQLGHMARTCPRLQTSQPPPQVGPPHIFPENNFKD